MLSGAPESESSTHRDLVSRRAGEKPIDQKNGIHLPVVIDFQGTIAKGLTLDFSLNEISFATDLKTSVGTSVSIQFCFGRNFAYINLPGRVVSVSEELPRPYLFHIVVKLDDLQEIERAILESCIDELGENGRGLGALSQGTDPPPSILSVFITDNPYLLHYRNTKREGQNNGDVRTHQIEPFTVHFSFSLIPRLLGSVVQLFRDLVIRFMPSGVARMLAPRIAFAFIAHPRDLTDVPRKFPLSYFFSPRLIDIWFKHQWPFVASYITGLKTKEGAEAIGAMLISPPTTTQMVKNPRLGRKRVLQAVKLAEKLGAQIVGLGAFTSIVTRDGHDLLGKSSVGITTGNPHSAAIAVQNVVMAAALTNLSLPHSTVAIVGGAGSMGSACAKLLSRIVAKLILIDIKREELKKVVEHLKGLPVEVQGSSSIEVVKLADVIIAATNSPHTIILSEHLKPGSIVIDAAQPKNVSEQIALSRKDVLVIESAVVETPGINCHFDLGLGPGEALGCLSETMILTAIGWQGHYSVGKADPTQAAQMIAAGRALGFKLAYFRNASGYITDEDLVYVANMRMTAMPYA